MIRASVAIMAHPKRKRFIPELQAKLDRPAQVVLDRRNDRWDTGRRTMLAYDKAATHHLVVQDDAVIPRDLVAGIEQALVHVPDGAPLCLYCGRTRPYRELVGRLVATAGSGTSWLTMGQLHWGVGIVMPTKWIAEMVAWCDKRPEIANYDRRISRWCQHRGLTVYYPWPSLVDHRDSPSLVPGRGSAGRRAHRFIGTDISALGQRWDGRVVSIPALNQTEHVTHSRIRWTGGQPVLFASLKYPTLDLSNKPGLHGVRFRDGLCEVDRSNAIAILQGPWWQRRGVRVATAEDIAVSKRLRKASQPKAEPGPEPTVAAAEPDGPLAAASPEPAPAAPPESVPGGSANTVLAWVGQDRERAQQALEAERERPKPRSSLVTRLEPIAAQKRRVAGAATAQLPSLTTTNTQEESHG